MRYFSLEMCSIAAALLAQIGIATAKEAAGSDAVQVVADQRFEVKTPKGSAAVPVYLSQDWTRAQPGITRVVITVHGVLRNADADESNAREALRLSGMAPSSVLLIEPQFLERVDVKANHLPADLLYWQRAGWESGEDAVGGAKVSSFAVIDAILAGLANRDLFPHLRDVVIAGHSGGGQMVQRYAVLGHGERILGASGVHVRYVVANPSSYVYFTADRPSAGDCVGYDDWKYGLDDLPPYGADSEKAALETRYVGRDVRYLLGTADIDPNHPALDKSCMAERQGPDRYARGIAYFRYLSLCHPGQFAQLLSPIADVGHDARKMFTAACGLSAVYDVPGCAAK